MELEDRYGVAVSEEQATRIKTVGDAVDFVLEHAPRPEWRSRGGALATLVAELPAELRERALTHATWTEERIDSYERLAYLGDSVLALAVASDLIDRFPDVDAGGLTKIHNQAVSGVSCTEVGRALGVPEMLREAAARRRAGDPGRGAARRRPGAAGGDRGADRRLLPRLRLRSHRAPPWSPTSRPRSKAPPSPRSTSSPPCRSCSRSAGRA